MMERDLHLADETVEPWELRPLLESLDAREFARDARVTLGAVAEATGHSLVDIAQSLGELRRQGFEARPVAPAGPSVSPRFVGPYGRHVFKDHLDPTAFIGIVALVLLSLILIPLLMSGSRSAPGGPPPGCTVHGVGGQRPCTAAEEAMFKYQRERGR